MLYSCSFFQMLTVIQSEYVYLSTNVSPFSCGVCPSYRPSFLKHNGGGMIAKSPCTYIFSVEYRDMRQHPTLSVARKPCFALSKSKKGKYKSDTSCMAETTSETSTTGSNRDPEQPTPLVFDEAEYKRLREQDFEYLFASSNFVYCCNEFCSYFCFFGGFDCLCPTTDSVCVDCCGAACVC